MSVKCGIVGLPNVGKSTLFNALTESSSIVAAENYPFCTIEPNIGRIDVIDDRLGLIAELAQSAQVIPTTINFVDIAGLVRGASKGEGLGNRFLAHIREVDAIAHIVRCFDDDNITHVEGGVDPLRDIDIIVTEMLLADLESLEKRTQRLKKQTYSKDSAVVLERDMVAKIIDGLQRGIPAYRLDWKQVERAFLPQLQLLSGQPTIYVCNVSESDLAQGNVHTQKVASYVQDLASPCVRISASLECELAAIDDDAMRDEYLRSLGVKHSGCHDFIQQSYRLLDLITFFTAGDKETRSWTCRRGALAPQAAGVIHSDFEDGFIKAEIIASSDYIACRGEAGAREAGKMRLEGREYVMQDGDIAHFRFQV